MRTWVPTAMGGRDSVWDRIRLARIRFIRSVRTFARCVRENNWEPASLSFIRQPSGSMAPTRTRSGLASGLYQLIVY